MILSSASLQTANLAECVDWVVAEEYAAVLRGHPRIGKLWEYRRRAGGGFLSWYRFARTLWLEGYDEVYDLHGSLRTRTLRILFALWNLKKKSDASVGSSEIKKKLIWKTASKQRLRSWGFILFKKLWPKRWLSRLQVEVFARTVGGTGSERPDLSHLLSAEFQVPEELLDGQYVCVMPGSNWPGKTWAAEKYLALIQEIGFFPVVMGTAADPESRKLVNLLQTAELPHYSGVGKWTLPEVASVLAGAVLTVGSDTGLALLSEAVGTDILVIYGPTAPGLGFEPWRSGSRTAGLDLWCRPCGKIGNRCYRMSRKHHCLRGLTANRVIEVFRKRWLT
ncbi:MAG: hypothetical protein A2X94_11145 [Bdellovibrionales bacterium GWB1_55_8]|nr:MAG: hypothetical protein A2X94_11145 [Bdellovibrionales bacterium GWB1_55_8]